MLRYLLSYSKKAVKYLIISVVGDIRTGKIQPTLTGNEIVDNALIANYSNQLQKSLEASGCNVTVTPEHFLDLHNADSDKYIFDQKVVDSLGAASLSELDLIVVDHSDLIWGNVSAAQSELTGQSFSLS
ncbi:hypothetical protein FC56_GL000730 [Lentilactobacillus senioris DSM 24302 = JCM 17472]|uniref:Uncharacterized protein n=1 Tax=Lentilactobacillus senioris DSM 24302 = JCM 17472 TaxID=1423802 RepID=A0A0R2CQR1_9LACO|nr:hypothetical protein FC56_GL000730 [Lentilactobacillus senioris DSM 24302 = JCM 17472]